MGHLKTRADFLRAAKGIRRSMTTLTLESCPTPDDLREKAMIRVGYTASRKVGGAVARNRAKRRLRAAAATLLPLYGREGRDYVLVARRITTDCPFARLLDDLAEAVRASLAREGRPAKQPKTERPHD